MAELTLEIVQHPERKRGWAVIVIHGIPTAPERVDFAISDVTNTKWFSPDGVWSSSQVSLLPHEWAHGDERLELVVGPEVVNRLEPRPINFVVPEVGLKSRLLWPKLDPSGVQTQPPPVPPEQPPRVSSVMGASKEEALDPTPPDTPEPPDWSPRGPNGVDRTGLPGGSKSPQPPPRVCPHPAVLGGVSLGLVLVGVLMGAFLFGDTSGGSGSEAAVLRDENRGLQSDLDQAETDHRETVRELQQDVADAIGAKQAAEEALSAAQGRIESLRQQIAALRGRDPLGSIRDLERDLQDAFSERDAMAADLTGARETIAELERDRNEAMSERDAMVADLASARDTVARLERELGNSNAVGRELRARLERCDERSTSPAPPPVRDECSVERVQAVFNASRQSLENTLTATRVMAIELMIRETRDVRAAVEAKLPELRNRQLRRELIESLCADLPGCCR